jgi:cell division GTPase FtsZ
MKLIVIGAGQGGSNIADEFAAMGEWVWKNRHVRIFTGSERDPIWKGVFAVNLGAGDLYGLKYIPQTDDHSILIGADNEFRGRGAGKVNADGAEQARKNSRKIVGSIRDEGDVYSADAILVIATTAGGTGSGSIGPIIDMMKDEFKKPVYGMLVLPFANQYDEPDSVINTATCIKRVVENSEADAVFLVDNQKFVRKGDSMGTNYSLINRRIADSFMDILCVGEETQRSYIGEVLDANDVIRILKGPSALGVSHAYVPPPPKTSGPLFGLFGKGNAGKPRHFSVTKAQVERAQNVVHASLSELSVDCEYEGSSGEIRYDAQNVLGLFSGPAEEATEEIVEMMDSTFAERVPGAGRRKGTYPGRTSDTISVTCIMANLGEGAAMDKVAWFYSEATKMIGESEVRREQREHKWGEIGKEASQLPDL